MRIGPKLVALLGIVAMAAPVLAGCGDRDSLDYDAKVDAKLIEDAVAAGLPRMTLTSLGTLPHPADVSTQGLELYDGSLYEAARVQSQSELRELDPKTGRLLRATPLPAGLDGGGITVIGSLLWQLTRKGGIALQWNRETLVAGGRAPWPGDGWGLCHAKDSLIASDGSGTLRVVDRNGVNTQRTIAVQLSGKPLTAHLGELECVPGNVLAVLPGTNWFIAINLTDGQVKAAGNVSELLPAESQLSGDRYLDGIARIPDSDEFLLTGHTWRSILRVRITF